MASVRLADLDLTFHVRAHRHSTLKEYALRLEFLRRRGRMRAVRALHGIDLRLETGDRVGVIGHNGAGKTTLLRTIAGIYPPTRGTRRVEGRISALFEIHLGFELEATGWDNILFRGLLMGATSRQMRAKAPGIAEFTELGSFLDVPVKYYSAGMMMRLAFAISTAIEPEILLVDECMNVGDRDFQQKAHDRMLGLIDRASLFVMVSHDPHVVASLCRRVIRLEHGRIVADGSVEQVLGPDAHARANRPVATAAA